jgi:hypothetical protein
MVAAKAMPGRENSMVQPSPEHTLNSRTVAGLGWLYLGLQQGGWSEEVITFIRLLAQHKVSASPPVPPTSNCSGIISSPFRTRSRTSPTPSAVMRSFACSLLMLLASASANVCGPSPLGDVWAFHVEGEAFASRPPLHR